MAADLSDSARDFLRAVWPAIRPRIQGGRLMPVESAAAKNMTTDLDVLAGIDAWQMLDSEGVMRGIASRVQWGPDSWRTFTIRRERPTGTPTELAKRLRAIDNPREGWLLPALTIQAYLTKPKPGGSLIEAAVVRTMDLYAYAQMNPCTKPRQNPADGVWFDWYRWDALRRVGCQVGTVVGTKQHLDDGLFPRPDGGPI